jgi:putative flippase GtrA
MNKIINYLLSLKTEFLKYAIVGFINLAFSLIIFYIFLNVMKMPYLVVFNVTWILGIILTYVINFVWVFKPDDKLDFKKRFVKYFSVYLSSYLVNIYILQYVVENYQYDPFWVQFFILPLVVLINFFGFKYWALKKMNNKK